MSNFDEMEPLAASEAGMKAAQENLAIPSVISAEDFINPSLDELSVMTYISLFRAPKRVDKVCCRVCGHYTNHTHKVQSRSCHQAIKAA